MKEAQSVYELFEEADTDKSGTISKEEFCVFGSNIDVSSDEEALELFDRVDTDNDGECGGFVGFGLGSLADWLAHYSPACCSFVEGGKAVIEKSYSGHSSVCSSSSSFVSGVFSTRRCLCHRPSPKLVSYGNQSIDGPVCCWYAAIISGLMQQG